MAKIQGLAIDLHFRFENAGFNINVSTADFLPQS